MKKIRKILNISLAVLGATTLMLLILALTPAPFYIWYNHSLCKAGIHRPPDYIVVLGGGGMPSESGLIRCWYGAQAANQFTRSKVIIALPGNVSDSLSSVNLMKQELILRGIAKERILLEDSGTNTRAQAVFIRNMITDYLPDRQAGGLRITDDTMRSPAHQLTNSPAILIVTSPEHLTRSVLTFKKVDFTRVDGIPAFDATIESDITFNDKKLGGRKWIPGIGENLTLRYRFWTQLRYEEMILREWMAILYYKLKGWI